jgi:hypothetical protein
MIDINKKYRTRDGREVRIYATDGGLGHCMTHGAAKNESGYWQSFSWYTAHGGYYDEGVSNVHDLIEVRPRHKRTVWMNVYKQSATIWDSKEHADARADRASYGRIACIKVDLDFEEGEGLNISAERVKKTGES